MPELPDTAPLLFFDSGIGGLSVLNAVQSVLPNAPIVFAADYAGLPYGTKTEAEISARVPALLGRLVERYRPRLVTIACNTACTIALSHVRAALNLPVVGTVPAIKPAAALTRAGVIGLLGTAATVRQAYVDQLQTNHAADMILLRHAAPDLVLAAEAKLRGQAVNPAVYADAMAGLRGQDQGSEMDVTILGCTHFPLVADELLSVSPGMRFVDGASGIANRILHLTRDQLWPAAAAPGIFVTTGEIVALDSLRPALNYYGLTQIKSL